MATRVAIHLREHKRSHRVGAALARGFQQHGLNVTVTSQETPLSTNIACVWGGHQEELRVAYLRAGASILIAEQGFFGDRDRWTSLGWGGVAGTADFRTTNVKVDRFDRYCDIINCRSWRDTHGAYGLIIGQVGSDFSVVPLVVEDWYRRTAAAWLCARRQPLAFRAHPLEPWASLRGVRRIEGSLMAALEGSFAVMTLSSTVGVQAMLAGIPTIAMDPRSMVYRIAARDVESLSIDEPRDRRRWAEELAYTQWTDDELASGEAWGHLCH